MAASETLTDPIAITGDRVRARTDPGVQEAIDRRTRDRVERLAQEGPWAIERRLGQLDQESDIERFLVVNASVTSLAGVAMAIFDRRWLMLPAAATGSLLQHALSGWSPPVPLLRRAGVRTRQEIEAERRALEARRS